MVEYCFHKFTGSHYRSRPPTLTIFLERLFYRTTEHTAHSADDTELSSSDLETLSYYLIENLGCIVFQNLLLTETRKSSCLELLPKKIRMESSVLVKVQAVRPEQPILL